MVSWTLDLDNGFYYESTFIVVAIWLLLNSAVGVLLSFHSPILSQVWTNTKKETEENGNKNQAKTNSFEKWKVQPESKRRWPVTTFLFFIHCNKLPTNFGRLNGRLDGINTLMFLWTPINTNDTCYKSIGGGGGDNNNNTKIQLAERKHLSSITIYCTYRSLMC